MKYQKNLQLKKQKIIAKKELGDLENNFGKQQGKRDKSDVANSESFLSLKLSSPSGRTNPKKDGSLGDVDNFW